MNSCPAQTKPNTSKPAGFQQETFLNVSQAAELLNISPSTLRRHETNGKISSVRKDNGYRSFRLSDINNLKETLLEEKTSEQKQVKEVIAPTPKNIYTNNEVRIQKAEPLLPSINLNVFKTLKSVIAPEYLLLVAAAGISFFLITSAHRYKNPENKLGVKDTSVKTTYHSFKGDELKQKTNTDILGIRDRVTNFVFNVNVPANIKNNLNVSGITTTTELAFQGVGRMLGLLEADETTENTLEELLDIDGDVVGTGLTDVKINDKVIISEYLADSIEYGGDWDFSGTWAIDGTEVTATADEINNLGEVSDALVSLADSTTESGGIAFGDGSKYIQDTTNFVWDDTNNRLGVGTNTPAYSIDVSGTLNTTSLLLGDTAVTSDANEINYLDGTTVTDGGIVFGNGTKLTQDVTGFYWNSSNDRLGIGNSNPSYNLDVLGTAQITNNIILSGTSVILSGTSTTFSQTAGNMTFSTIADKDIVFATGSGGLISLTSSNEKVYIEGNGLIVNDASNLFIADVGRSNVQIGSDDASTTNKLNVVGNIGLDDYLFFNNTYTLASADTVGIRLNSGTGVLEFSNIGTTAWSPIASAAGTAADGSAGAVQFSAGGGTFTSDIDNFYFDVTGDYLRLNAIRGIGVTNPLFITDYNGVGGITVESGGYVGIANTNPNYALDVAGDINTSTDLYIAGVGLGSTATASGATKIGIDYGSLLNAPTAQSVQQALEALDSVVGAAAGDIQAVGSISTGQAFNSIATADGQWLGLGAADGRIAFTTSPSSQIHLLDANVGIGTTNATSQLEVVGEIKGTKFTFQDSANVYFDTISADVLGIGTSGAYRVTIDEAGYMGIGTTDPDAMLTINPSAAAALNIKNYNSGAGQTGELRFYGINGTYVAIKAPDSAPGNVTLTLPPTDGGADQVLATDGSGVMTWMDVSGVGSTASGDITAVGSVGTGEAFSSISSADGQWLGLGVANGRIYFADDTTDEISILAANFGIGKTNPSVALDVAGALTVTSDITFSGLGSTNTFNSVLVSNTATGKLFYRAIDSRVWGSALTDGSGVSNYMTRWTDTDTLGTGTIYDNGSQVGIGTTDPTAGLHVNATARFSGSVAEAAQSIDRIDIGVENGTPRMVFEDVGSTIWEVDNSSGIFRWFTPGVERLTLDGSGDIDLKTGGLKVGAVDVLSSSRALSNLTGITSSGTITLTGVTTSTDNTVLLLNTSNQLIQDEIDSRVWGSALTDGSGVSNYMTRWTDTDTLGTGTLYDNGTSIGLGTTGLTSAFNITPSTIAALQINPSGTNPAEFRLLDSNSGEYTGFKSPNTLVQNIMYTLPASTGAVNYVLATDGSNNLSWQSVTGVGAGDVDGIGVASYAAIWTDGNSLGTGTLYDNSSGVGIGTTAITSSLNITPTTLAALQINPSSTNPAEFRLLDSDSGEYTGFKAPNTLSQNIIYSLPASTGAVNYVLATDGSNNLSWQSVTGVGAGDVDGTGVANYAAIWLDSNSLTTGKIYDTGTYVGIGKTNPGVALDVAGAITASTTVTGATLTDGTASLASGSLTGGVNITASGDITFSGLGSTNTGNNVLVANGSGKLDYRTIDASAWNANLINGTGVSNYLTRWLDADTTGIGLVYDTGTYVGIGKTNPGVALDVVGAITASTTITGTTLTDGTASLTSGAWTGVTNITMSGTLDLGDNTIADGTMTGNWGFSGGSLSNIVGIGTTSLTASGATVVFSGLGSTNAVNNVLVVDGSGNIKYRSVDDNIWGSALVDGSGVSNYVTYWLDADTLASEQYLATSRGGLGGNVTASGAGEIIYSTGTTTYDSLAAGNSSQLLISGGAGAPSWSNIASLLSAGDDIDITGTTTAAVALEDDIDVSIIRASGPGGLNIYDDGSNLGLFVKDGGNVGVGTTNPNSKLEVIGEARTQKYAFQDSANVFLDTISTDVLGIGTSGLYRAYISASGLMGIGTTSAGGKLEVETGAAENQIALVLDQNNTTNNPKVLQIENAGTGDAIYIDSGEFIIDSTGNMTSTGTTGITLNANADVTIGTIGIRDTGSSTTTSGAYMIGHYGAGNTYATGDDVQEAIGQLDSQLGSVVSGFITGVGSMTSGDVFANSNADGDWLGLGAAAGRIYFADDTVDEISIMDAYLGIGVTNPLNRVDVLGNMVIGSNYAAVSTAPTNGLLVEGSMGLGTNSPKNKLDVEGEAVIGSAYSGTVTAPTDGLLVEGKLGIGISSMPSTYKVYFGGGDMGLDASAYINFGATNSVNGYGLRDNGGTIEFKDSGGSWTEMGGGYWDLISTTLSLDADYATSVGIGVTNTAISLDIGVTAPDQEMIRLQDGTDNIGIFTVDDNPDGVITGSKGSLALDYTNGKGYISTDDSTTWEQILTGNDAFLQGGNSFGTIGTLGTNDAFDLAFETSGTTQATLTTDGNFGIGTTSPLGQLSLYLDSGDTYGYYTNTSSDFTGALLYLAHDSNRIFEVNDIQATFEVPVNMASSGDVNIANNINFTNLTSSYITSDGPMYIQAGNVGEAESLYLSSAGSGNVYVDDDLYVTGDSYLDTGNKLVFDSDDSSDSYMTHDNTNNWLSLTVDNVEQVRFLSSGTTSMDLNTVINSNAFDVAEMYPTADSTITAGMIVSLKENAELDTYTVIKTEGDTDTNTLGIVSTKPGVLMGGNSFQVDFCKKVETIGEEAILQEEIDKLTPQNTPQDPMTEQLTDVMGIEELPIETEKDNVTNEHIANIKDKIKLCNAIKEVPITLSGRVPVKIAPDSADIKVGDSLTASKTFLGYAQKATTKDQVVVGKSLENWKTGTLETSIMAVTGIIWNSTTLANNTETPQDILGAMTSKLDEFKQFADSMGFRMDETTNVLDINSDMNVMGEATFADVTITGELNIGLMEIDSLNNSIQILGPKCGSNSNLCDSQALYLQKNLAGNVNIFNGKVVIMTNGNISTSGTIEANKILASEYSVKGTSKSVGSDTLYNGNKEVKVYTNMIRDNSKVFITATNNTKGETLYVKEKINGEYFIAAIDNSIDSNIEFDWFIVNID